MRGLLLGLDVVDVWCGCRECRLDAGAGGRNDCGEEHAVGAETECSARASSAGVGGANFAESFLVIAKLNSVQSLYISNSILALGWVLAWTGVSLLADTAMAGEMGIIRFIDQPEVIIHSNRNSIAHELSPT